MTVSVEIAREASDELLAGLNRLVPQLSGSAKALDIADLIALVESPATTLFVARDDGVVVGTLTLVVVAIPTGVRAWIEDVVVEETVRGSGVGESLTLAAIEEARRRQVRTIDLTSRPSREAANSMYLKVGFVTRETNVYRFLVEGS
ncbi:MAG: GNAT family N-acetyltransferase [Acidimicrobiales bacterium]